MEHKTGQAKACIKILGIGGCGSRVVNLLMEERIPADEYISINTGCQAVSESNADICLQIGAEITKGRGAGGDPGIGRKAAEANGREIAEAIKGCDLLLMLVGLGRGTGTGATPVIAQIARKHGIKTAAIVTMPFDFEGSSQQKRSKDAVDQLQELVDSLTVLPNDQFLRYTSREKMTLSNAFALTDEVLVQLAKNTVGIARNIAFKKKHSILEDFWFKKRKKRL